MSEEIEAKKSVGSYVDSTFNRMRENPWMPASIVLALILVVVLFMGGGVTGNAVSESTVEKNILAFAKSQGVEAKVDSIKLDGALYQVMLSIDGQQVPMYVTLDGKQLIQQPISLDGSAAGTQPTTSASKKASELDLTGSPIMGSSDAKLTIIEFSDFSCPFCGAASGDSEEYVAYMKQRDSSWEAPVFGIINEYVKTGKVKFVFKYFPGHGTGEEAMKVGWCLNEQNSDLFWKFHNLAFANQDQTGDLTKMKELAKQVGGDMGKLDSCLSSGKYDAKLTTDTNEGRAVGVDGTPAFFIGDTKVSGAVSFNQLKTTIEAELAKL